jgi:hypothetical protein
MVYTGHFAAAVFDELGERPHRGALWLEGVQLVAMGQQQFELEQRRVVLREWPAHACADV